MSKKGIPSIQCQQMPERALARIRRFEIEDIDEILQIEAQAFPKTAYSRAILLNYATALPDGFVVLETGKEVVGYMIFDRGGHIHSTAVKAVYRRRGFGRMLFMHAMECAKEKLWLEVRSKNIVAIKFYRKLGMNVIGTIPKYYGNDDALIMTLIDKEKGGET